jgi:beta-lactamase superfamily II metal-dependent hydrolase
MTAVATAIASHTVQATVSTAGGVLDETLERVAKGLRGARARAGLSEQQVVAILAERGVAIDVAVLRRAEHIGALDLALAAHLADLYGSTTDCLAGRRPNRHQLVA